MRTQPQDGENPTPRAGRGAVRWGMLFRVLWIAAFAPFLIGFLVSGIIGHPIFLAVFVLWAGALACLLRAEYLDDKARGMVAPSARLLGARAGWVAVTIALIFASGGLVRLAFGPHGA